MADVVVAFLWHYHQPDYRNPATGEAVLPWTRLHGVKDYYSMARIAAEFPEIKQNFNFVPAMLEQLLDISGGGSDLYLRISRKPAGELEQGEKEFLLKEFFSANWNTMVEPFPRYRELLDLSGRKTTLSAPDACKRWTEQDFRDLQVWFNLAWFHPYSREKEPLVAQLIEKGKGFSEEDKNLLLDLQVKLLGEIVPLYRSLSESGLAELTTTPFYHPIMPLLCDTQAAHESMQGAPLPASFPRAPEDALAQMRKAVQFHADIFGTKPRGCWPSEGSVSTHVINILAEAGIEWCATDEEILAATLSRSGKSIRLDGDDRGSLLYHAYQANSDSHSIKVIFRDHYLSDLIGFTYYTYEPKAAASDLVGHLHRIADVAASKKGTWIVPIILDGENAWESYPEGGLTFFRELFGLLSVSRRVRTARISDYLADNQSAPLDGLFAGSWIGHNFRIWIGEEINNKGWEYLGKTRRALTDAGDSLPAHDSAKAWEGIYRAEGSDWFWWFSEQHSSPHDEQFDMLFRSHLKSVFEVLGGEIPGFIDEPIVRITKSVYTQPYALLDVRIDGRRSDYFEWLCAGKYEPGRDQGAMARPAGALVSEVYFGFNLESFYLRVDLDGKMSDLSESSLTLSFLEPEEIEIRAEKLTGGTLEVRGKPERTGEIAVDRFVEISVPFKVLGIGQGQNVRFQLEFSAPGGAVEKLPYGGPIAFKSPTEEFEMIQWQA